MRLKVNDTAVEHGIVRQIDPVGGIIEASYKRGKVHGLYRLIRANLVRIWICRDGNRLADLRLNRDLKEVRRDDPCGLIRNLRATHFMRI